MEGCHIFFINTSTFVNTVFLTIYLKLWQIPEQTAIYLLPPLSNSTVPLIGSILFRVATKPDAMVSKTLLVRLLGGKRNIRYKHLSNVEIGPLDLFHIVSIFISQQKPNQNPFDIEYCGR